MNGEEIAGLNIDWAELMSNIQTVGFDFLKGLIAAIAIFYVGRMVAGAISKGVHKIMDARDVDEILVSFITSMVRWGLMAVVIIAAIQALGIPTTSLVAMVGAAGLAVGLAMQGSLANFAAGVLIVLFRPYRVGDYIEAAGIAGSVEEVQILTTILKTPDNKQIIVPNGQVMGSIITNYSTNPTRRADLTIGVSYDDDIDKVRATIAELVNADDRILKDPECQIKVAALADSSVNFTVRSWVKTDDYWNVMFDLTEAVKKRFDQDSISFPFPQQDVHLYKADS